MSARREKGRAPKGVRPEWWERPTFMTRGPTCWPDQTTKMVEVELILPNGEKVKLGQLPDDCNLRLVVGQHFKELWDPKKFQRRTPT